jgi:hypothetical protein
MPNWACSTVHSLDTEAWFFPGREALHQLLDGAGLVAPGFVAGNELKVHEVIIDERRTISEDSRPGVRCVRPGGFAAEGRSRSQ